MEPFDNPSILHEALRDRRVTRALHLACRDARLRARFEALRDSGCSVEMAVAQLRRPHSDADGRPYYLSDERVRSIVYQKG